jgi:hypothetical protein
MPTATQKRKRALRSLNNACAKLAKAEARREADIELGKTVIVTEVDGVKKYAFSTQTKRATNATTLDMVEWKDV